MTKSIVLWRPQVNNIYHMDALTLLRSMPDESVDLIATDPPYYRAIQESWDRQWNTRAEFLSWLGLIFDEFRRVLKFNGSVYVFASPKMAAHVQVEIDKRFNVLNSIVWNKPALSWSLHSNRKLVRSYIPVTERVIFAEHYNADNWARGETSYMKACDELRGFVFEPLRAYLENERIAAGVKRSEVDKACGVVSMASSHYFSKVQWCLPTAEHYESMRRYFNRNGGQFLQRSYESLRQEYESLRQEYESLRQEYESLRRPFDITTAGDNDREIWNFYEPPSKLKGHPTRKPLNMIEHIISTSSKTGALVLDPFMGSGTAAVAAANLNRHYIGCDASLHYVQFARQRVAEANKQSRQLSLFEVTS